jgi:prepilin-type N-terminal cleavage/methylation domain-containing protein
MGVHTSIRQQLSGLQGVKIRCLCDCKERGFTLIELIIVVVIIVLILGMSTLFFASTLPSAKLNGISREMSSMIKQARILAQNKGEKQTLIIDLDSRTYGIEGRSVKAIPPEITARVIDPLSGEVYRGKYSFIFHDTGGIEGGTILLTYSKKTVSIETDPVVGSIVMKQ